MEGREKFTGGGPAEAICESVRERREGEMRVFLSFSSLSHNFSKQMSTFHRESFSEAHMYTRSSHELVAFLPLFSSQFSFPSFFQQFCHLQQIWQFVPLPTPHPPFPFGRGSRNLRADTESLAPESSFQPRARSFLPTVHLSFFCCRPNGLRLVGSNPVKISYAKMPDGFFEKAERKMDEYAKEADKLLKKAENPDTPIKEVEQVHLPVCVRLPRCIRAVPLCVYFDASTADIDSHAIPPALAINAC